MSVNPPISKTEFETLAEFRYTLRRYLHFSEAAVEEVGLTPQQYQAMLMIQGFPGREKITVGELAERLQIRQHSAVGLVNRLEAENLIIRTSAEIDRRVVFLSLTNHGLLILEKLTKAHRNDLRRLSSQLLSLLEQISKLQ